MVRTARCGNKGATAIDLAAGIELVSGLWSETILRIRFNVIEHLELMIFSFSLSIVSYARGGSAYLGTSSWRSYFMS